MAKPPDNLKTPPASRAVDEPSPASDVYGPGSSPSGVRQSPQPAEDEAPTLIARTDNASASHTRLAPYQEQHEADADDRTVVPNYDVATFAHEAEHGVDVDFDGAAPADTEQATRSVPTGELMHKEMYARFLASDYPAAMTVAESLLQIAPGNTMALSVIERCKQALDNGPVSARRFGLSPEDVLELTIGPQDLKLLPLDPPTMFVLSMIDGRTDLDTVFAMTGVPADSVMEKLADLLKRGIVVRAG